MAENSSYLASLVDSFWRYRDARFDGEEVLFDQQTRRGMRTPVFLPAHAIRNVIVQPGLTESQIVEVRRKLSKYARHQWFRSMKSSQALVQSIFGNLCSMKLCSALKTARTEEGDHPFGDLLEDGSNLELEHEVDTLGERRATSVDIFLRGASRVAIECKLAEIDVGHCSRPELSEDETEYCDGDYKLQHERKDRCSLTSVDVKYWKFVPKLFTWRADCDHAPCPLRPTYQLVRNVLAASIGRTGEVVPGYSVLLFDARNPSFKVGGSGFRAFTAVKAGLIDPNRIQRLSFQTVIRDLRKDSRLEWLTSEVAAKYGL